MARRSKPKGIWQTLQPIAIVLMALVATPVVLTPAYLFIDPISVPMLERYLTRPAGGA